MLKLELSKAPNQPDVIIDGGCYFLASLLVSAHHATYDLWIFFFSLLSLKVFCGHIFPLNLNADFGISIKSEFHSHGHHLSPLLHQAVPHGT